MEKNLNIKAEFDCEITIMGQDFYLVQDVTQYYKINTNDKTLCIRVYPISTCLVPYTMILYLYSLSSTCEYCDIIDYGDNNIFIKLKPFYRPTVGGESKKKYATFGNKSHEIIYHTHSSLDIRIQCDSKYIDIKYNKPIKSLEFVTDKDKILIYCKLFEGYYIAIVSFTNNYKVEKAEEVFLLEKTKEEIVTLKILLDSGHHGRVNHYNIESNMQNSKDIVYMDEAKQNNLNKELVPYLYIDAIKCEDKKLARTYLCDLLNTVLDDEHLMTFFGDFCDIDSPCFEQSSDYCISLIYDNNGKKQGKIYSFDINDENKITNITQV